MSTFVKTNPVNNGTSNMMNLMLGVINNQNMNWPKPLI